MTAPIDIKQGAIKISEVSTDEANSLLGTALREDSSTVINEQVKILDNILSKEGITLTSNGKMKWDNNILYFYYDGTASNLIVYLTQINDSTKRTIQLVMNGGALDSDDAFEQIPLNNNELIYLDLNISAILTGTVNGIFNVKNGVFNPSILSSYGAVLRKTTLGISNGMPVLNAMPDNSSDATFNTLIALRQNITINSIVYNNLYWYPHGIKWESGTADIAGTTIVTRANYLPDYAVSTFSDLQSAIIRLSLNGGIILLDTNGTEMIATDNINISNNVILWGRGSKETVIKIANSSYSITVGNNAEIKNIKIKGDTTFNSGSLLTVPLNISNSKIKDCLFELTNTLGDATCISVNGNHTRIINCTFGTDTNSMIDNYPSNRTGINYLNGTNNADIDSRFPNVSEYLSYPRGIDGYLIVNAQTTPVYLQSGITRDYEAIIIDSGCTLIISGGNQNPTILNCKGDCTINGTIRANLVNNDGGTYVSATPDGIPLTYTVTQVGAGDGGRGGGWLGSLTYAGLGGAGVSPSFEGYGGGGGGGGGNSAYGAAAGGRGGAGNSSGQDGSGGVHGVAGVGGSTGGNGNGGNAYNGGAGGGSGGGGGGGTGGYANTGIGGGGGGGGNKGYHGGGIFIRAQNIIGNGKINVSGQDGWNGGHGGAGYNGGGGYGGGGGGGGGAGGSGGTIWLYYKTSISSTLTYTRTNTSLVPLFPSYGIGTHPLLGTTGSGGSGGSSDPGGTNWGGSTAGGNGSNGYNGTVTIAQYLTI